MFRVAESGADSLVKLVATSCRLPSKPQHSLAALLSLLLLQGQQLRSQQPVAEIVALHVTQHTSRAAMGLGPATATVKEGEPMAAPFIFPGSDLAIAGSRRQSPPETAFPGRRWSCAAGRPSRPRCTPAG